MELSSLSGGPLSAESMVAMAPSGVVDPAQIEREILRLRGVQAARVEIGPGRVVSKIHAVASADRDPKQLVRDIESLLLATFRLRVDYRRISLVPVGDGQPAAPHALQRARVMAVEPMLDDAPGYRVTLRSGATTVTGEARLPAEQLTAVRELRRRLSMLADVLAAAADVQDHVTRLASQYNDLPPSPLLDLTSPDLAGGPPSDAEPRFDAAAWPAIAADTELGLDENRADPFDSLGQVEAVARAAREIAPLATGLGGAIDTFAERLLARQIFPLVAEATINAVNELVGRRTGAVALAGQTVTLGVDQALVVTIEAPRGRGFHKVAGCVLLVEAIPAGEAIGRATLDAMNRHLSVNLTPVDAVGRETVTTSS